MTNMTGVAVVTRVAVVTSMAGMTSMPGVAVTSFGVRRDVGHAHDHRGHANGGDTVDTGKSANRQCARQ